MTTGAHGVLHCVSPQEAWLRSTERSFLPHPEDVFVSTRLIKQHALVNGARVTGEAKPGRRRHELSTVTQICGKDPADFATRLPFDKLPALSPSERFDLGQSGNLSMRVMDLITPLGKGSRCLIVAPPRTGKTRLLQEIATSIHAADKNSRVLVLLIDERPEEVTEFRRSVPAEVLASSSDQDIRSHVSLASLAMDHIRCELECGRDTVVLVDSITRLTRAFNLSSKGAGRTMSGGLDARAMEIPRRFFGLARKVEGGGSVTIIATALIDTGSRMDQLIYEEFKGTGNSELVLKRQLADQRIFPAIDVKASGTRREELLFPEEESEGLNRMRGRLASMDPRASVQELVDRVRHTRSNSELLRQIASVGR